MDTVIIGGGFAGVTAARELSKYGHNVILLEARDRLGGRTWTTNFNGSHVELGGTYVHWFQPSVWSEIQRYGLPIVEGFDVESDYSKCIYLEDGQPKELNWFSWLFEMKPIFQQFFESSYEVWPHPYDAKKNWDAIITLDDKTALDRLNEMDLTQMQRSTLTAYIEVSAHTKIQNISYSEMMRWYALAGHKLESLNTALSGYRLKDGTISLIEAILSDADAEVRLSTKVTKIEQSDKSISIQTDAGDSFSADKVLLTVPMNVVNDIEFNPPLSSERKEAAIERHAGEGFKVLLSAKGRYDGFWCCSPLAECPLMSVAYYLKQKEHTILVAYGYSPSPVNLDDHEQMQEWMQMYIPDIQIEKSIGHSWVDDSFSQGTWCTYKPGQLKKYFEALQQDQENIFFASGDIGDGWRGFIDGAISSGIKAARRIVNC